MAGILYSSEKCVPVSPALFLTQKEEPFCLASSNGKPSLEKEENGTEEPGRWSISKALRQDLNL